MKDFIKRIYEMIVFGTVLEVFNGAEMRP